MTTLQVSIPDELREQLERFCKQQNLPVNDVVRDSLRRYMAVEEFRALRKKMVPHAEAQGILTDEDVFRIIS